jgi:hypothetical protein
VVAGLATWGIFETGVRPNPDVARPSFPEKKYSGEIP